jgi:hypothetical protein
MKYFLQYLSILILITSCSSSSEIAETSNANSTLTPLSSSQPTLDQLASSDTANVLFEGTFGGDSLDVGINAIQLYDGGYALLGYTASFGLGGEDILLVRLDTSGNFLWSNTYGGSGTDNGWDLTEQDDGSLIILGFSDSFSTGDFDMYLINVDSLGELIWSETYGGPGDEYGWSLLSLDGDGFILAGETNSIGNGRIDALLIRVDPSGGELWQQTYGGAEDDRIFAVAGSQETGFALAGTTESNAAGRRDAYIVNTDSQGQVQWKQVIGETQDDVAHDITQLDDGSYLVTGYTRSFDAENYDALLIRFSAVGEIDFQSTFGGPQDDRTISGVPSADGGYLLAGYSRSMGASGWDVYVAKTDQQGDPTWQQNFGGISNDTGYTLLETIDNSIFIVGTTHSSGQAGDLFWLAVDQ